MSKCVHCNKNERISLRGAEYYCKPCNEKFERESAERADWAHAETNGWIDRRTGWRYVQVPREKYAAVMKALGERCRWDV